jgi:hypothetical protein
MFNGEVSVTTDIMCSVNEVDFDGAEQYMEKKSVLLYVSYITNTCVLLRFGN